MSERHRRYCITWNNYDTDSRDIIMALSDMRFCIIGTEIAKTGTPHLQIYVEFTKQKRWEPLKRSLPKCHIEPAKGTAEQNIAYCSKDKEFETIGSPARPGTRNDLTSLKNDILNGHTKMQCFDDHLDTMVRYRHMYNDIKLANVERVVYDRSGAPVVKVLVGLPGTGKTRTAHDFDPDLYSLDITGSTIWFDGYYGQETVLIDDYYGEIKYSFFLRLLDRYVLRVQTKGGHTYWRPKTIFITSNSEVKKWYPTIDISALERRITEVSSI